MEWQSTKPWKEAERGQLEVQKKQRVTKQGEHATCDTESAELPPADGRELCRGSCRPQRQPRAPQATSAVRHTPQRATAAQDPPGFLPPQNSSSVTFGVQSVTQNAGSQCFPGPFTPSPNLYQAPSACLEGRSQNGLLDLLLNYLLQWHFPFPCCCVTA